MATFEAEMAAVASMGGDKSMIRKIVVPDKEITGDVNADLERIFYWGQNDAQPQYCPSLSVGDVVRYGDKRFIVAVAGFRELKPGEKGGVNEGYGFRIVRDS